MIIVLQLFFSFSLMHLNLWQFPKRVNLLTVQCFSQDDGKKAFDQQDTVKGSKSHNNISKGEPAGAFCCLVFFGGFCEALLRLVSLLLPAQW